MNKIDYSHSKNDAKIHSIQSRNETQDMVDEYVYLGLILTARPGFELDIKRRIKFGWSAF